MNILVTGCNGQLGKEFQKIAKTEISYNWFFTDIDTLDICDETKLNDLMQKYNINICINCAAYTAVDKAEDEIDKARLINADAVRILAETCKNNNILLVHISTDYVFDGSSDIPYKEDDILSPKTVYGKTKAEGERYIINSDCSYIIVRTSWLYSANGNNFVKTMLRLASEKEFVSVVCDQNGNPTWAYDLAFAIVILLQRNNNNKKTHEIFHYSNEGITSWYNFAEAIFDISNKKCTVKPISTKDYPSKATRPSFSALDKDKIKKFTGLNIPFWRDSLIKCIEEINNNN